MSQSADADEVDTLLGIVADGVEGDAARRLSLEAVVDDVDSLLRIGHGEVVEHDTVNAAVVEHLLQFVERAHLDLNLQVETLFLQVLMAAVDGVDNAAGKVDVVVLQQNHVEETDTMVAAAANLHGLLLEHAHARSGLAGVEHAGARSLQSLHVLIGHGGNAAHALHDVQHQALSLKQRAHLARDNHGDIALLHPTSVAHQHLHLHRWIEAAEHLLGYLHTSQYAVFLNEKMALTHCIFRNAAEGGVVAVANVLGKRQVDEPVD